MVLIDLPVNVFNLIKFILVELLISIILQPAWELFISRTTHARVRRGERVPLSTLPKSRTFPFELVTGRVTAAFALGLSLLTLGGSLALEYAVDAASVTKPSSAEASVFARDAGRAAKDHTDFPGLYVIAERASRLADRCYFREGARYFVQPTFTDGNDSAPCYEQNNVLRQEVSDVCVMTKTQGESNLCLWNATGASFVVQQIAGVPETEETSIVHEATSPNRSLIHYTCDFERCVSNKTYGAVDDSGQYSSRLFCGSGSRAVCLYVSARFVSVTWFSTETGTPNRGEIPLLVFRNVQGMRAYTGLSVVDHRILAFFRESFEQGTVYSSFRLGRQRDGVILMLMLEGFGRSEDVVTVQDYRRDTQEQWTRVDVRLFGPILIATVVLVCTGAFAALMQPRRNMVFQVPVSTEQLMQCARARETEASNWAFGLREKKLQLGFVVDADGGQRLSVNAGETVPYDASRDF